MTAGNSRRQPRALETRSHAPDASLRKTPYSPPATPGLPPSTLSPFETKHTRTDALSSAEDNPGSLRSPTFSPTIHHPPTPSPPPSTSAEMEDVSPCPCPSFSSTFSVCYHTCSYHHHQQQVPQSIQSTGSLPSLRAANDSSVHHGSLEHSMTIQDTDQWSSAAEASSTVSQQDILKGHCLEQGIPSVAIPTRSSSMHAIQRYKQAYQRPCRYAQSNPFPVPSDICYHYSSGFPSPASQQATRSSLRRLRRQSLHRSSNNASVVSMDPCSMAFSMPTLPFVRQHEEPPAQHPLRQQSPPSLPPSLQPITYGQAHLRGRRRLTIEKCMHARQQQPYTEDLLTGARVNDDDECNSSNNSTGHHAGVVGMVGPLFMSRTWTSSYDSLRPQPPSPPRPLPRLSSHMRQAEDEDGSEDWDSPELVTAMRPLSSATYCWSDVAVMDPLAEEGQRLGPWVSTAY